jgi:hypothetical protein
LGISGGIVEAHPVAVLYNFDTYREYREFFNAEQIMTEWSPSHVSEQQLTFAVWHTLPL